ncbi:phage tail sheath C-terminal domain-containing protein [Paraburkholderia xenovorans]|uniref:phage tail sheath family protein n=1 Tax=Paraburkholderia xenovorans TaxID=36873 RepID=UPI0038B7A0F3
MTVTTTYPGVYVEEDSSISLSIFRSPTAVPVFVLGDNDPLVEGIGYPKQMLRIDSWMDYLSKLKIHISQTYSLKFDDSENGLRDTVIRAYFESGGGYCYVVTVDYGSKSIPLLDDITLVVAAGQNIVHSGWTDVTQFCQPGSGRFVILDGPKTEIDSSYTPDWLSASYAAVYYPWLTVDWTANHIPPSVVAAGIYCSVDRARGVWKAPANVYLPSNYQVLYRTSDDLQGQFNQGSSPINMIRVFGSDPPIVWGARTSQDSDDWRYISVRRLFDSAERDIKTSLQAMVFEPNSQPTWEKVRTAITNYLRGLWSAGALVGTTEKDAFFVDIDEGVTMTSDDIAQGKMIVNVGMAAVRPAEFIIVQFTQDVGQG